MLQKDNTGFSFDLIVEQDLAKTVISLHKNLIYSYDYVWVGTVFLLDKISVVLFEIFIARTEYCIG